MKINFRIKEKVVEVAEHLYDLSKRDVVVNVTKKGVKTTEKRPTKRTIKWRAKGH
ncbi:hypothetical protein [Enterococcus lemanii]|jgi:hypothetical protein|uniref:Uncharacterized protein n=1 Tax=Enterococcus lemanii TaxID=1159752 RepID=A0ABV9MYS7_9ENTE|nr:hypothetical protein [Enterococcus lemanii]MBM7710335.1 archaellum component FlaF (FlaF/FlaG flagellin family) [Enterococcus lemanii]